MYKKVKKALLILFSAVFVTCGVVLTACNMSCNDNDTADYTGLFSGDSHNYVLSSDYKLTDADVNATKGEDNVTLDYICSFNLNGHSLDLNGYTLKIVSDSKDAVKFSNGSIKNGSLDISVPNGDIEFNATDIESSVVSEFEAASETIKIANSSLSGKSTVKSNTNVSIEYSNVGDITLSGNGTLTAGSGADMGAVTISENASGATVNIAPDASVVNMQLQASANVKVAGSVSSVTVAESAKNDTNELSIEIQASATVTKVELNASAKVDVKGTVQAVTVSETAKNDTASLSINVAEGAEIARVELKAPAEVAVSGGVDNIVVTGSANGSSVTLTETASVATVAVNAEDITIDSDENANVSKVVVAESVKDKVTSNIEFVTATEEEMEDYLAHQHIFVISSKENATCTEAGKIVYICDCGETKQEAIPALGHSYTYEVIKEPTADANGEGRYTCTRCGHSYTVEIVKSVSFVIDSLHELFSFIPEGTYNVYSDSADPITLTQDNGGKVTVKNLETVINVENSALYGTLKFELSIEPTDGEEQSAILNVVIDDTIVHVYMAETYINDNEEGEYINSAYLAMSAGLKTAFAQFMPFDIDNLDGVLSFLKSIKVGEADGIVSALLEKVVDGAFTVKNSNGDKVYVLDVDKLVKSLTALGDSTPAEVLDGILGEGTFDAIYSLLDGVADKTVLTVVSELYKIAEKYGISQDQLFSLAQTVIDNIMPGADGINIKDVVVGYYDKTVAYTVADLMQGATEAEVKEMIEGQINGMLGYVTDLTVSELIESMLGGSPDYETEGEGMSFASIIEMVGAYAENATVSVTLDSQNKLKAFEISYVNTENGINVSIIKTADSSVPEVVVNVMGVEANLDETEGGAELTVNLMGMLFTLSADKTDNGASLGFTAKAGEEEIANVNLDIIANKDAQGNLIGAELVFSGEIDCNATLAGGYTSNYEWPEVSIGPGFADDYDEEPVVPEEPEKTAPIIINGKLSLVMNGGAEIDESIWNSFDGDKEIFYHMDVTAYKSYYGVVTLKWVSEGADEYYLLTKTEYESYGPYIYEIVSTAKVLSINGLPEVIITYENDCNDWIKVNFFQNAVASVVETRVAGGRIEYKDGIPVLAGGIRDVIRSYTAGTEFTGILWLNTKTGETSDKSAHNLVYTGKLADGAESCEDGTVITISCTECDYTQTLNHWGHYCEETELQISTQCGNESYILLNECVVCGYKYITCNLYNDHDYTDTFHGRILSEEEYGNISEENGYYISISEVAELGYETAGFYYGDVYVQHCAECGLNVYNYVYYTNTPAEGCLRHNIYYAVYNGNEYYEGFTGGLELVERGHYSYINSSYGEYSDVNTAVNEVKALGIDLPFTPETATYNNHLCDGCGKVLEKNILLNNDSINGFLNIYIYYGEDGNIERWEYNGYVHNASFAINEAEKISGVFSDDLVAGYVEYFGYSDSYKNTYIYLYTENGSHGDTLRVDMKLWVNGNGERTIREYRHANCEVTKKYLLLDSKGNWILKENEIETRHDYEDHYEYSENCNEDGYYYLYACSVCGASSSSDGEYNIGFGHEHITIGQFDVDIHDYAYQLLKDYNTGVLYGLDATLTHNGWCIDCGTVLDATIVLRDNWTLTGDVYLKAEGLTLDLNGYTIDLNGYNLVLYSYCGRTLVVTDSSFDTSSVEDFDPENPQYTSAITNSDEDSGIFIVASMAFSPYDYSVIIGSIAIEADNFLTDEDDRYSLYNSVYFEYGIELEILKAERPYWFNNYWN